MVNGWLSSQLRTDAIFMVCAYRSHIRYTCAISCFMLCKCKTWKVYDYRCYTIRESTQRQNITNRWGWALECLWIKMLLVGYNQKWSVLYMFLNHGMLLHVHVLWWISRTQCNQNWLLHDSRHQLRCQNSKGISRPWRPPEALILVLNDNTTSL